MLVLGKAILVIDKKKRIVKLIALIFSGLDIPTVECVLNYDIPRDPTDYIHRVGRTARAGRGGKAISIVAEKDIQLVQNIETHISK
jgi:superfamily II DNA/RNA helicase